MYVDPGEETGWCIAAGDTLLGGGQTKLWQFAHDVADVLYDSVGPLAEGETDLLRPGITGEQNVGKITLVVYEVFALYPWKAKDLAWDQMRTAQLIGAIKLAADRNNVPVESQPAKIKERAVAGGAEELFVRPLHENRHQNDSIMHFVFKRAILKQEARLKELGQ